MEQDYKNAFKRIRDNKEDELLEDINKFIESVMFDNNGLPVKQAEIHRMIQEHIDDSISKGKNPAILAPWGHGKSIQIVARTIFSLIKNTNLRSRIISASDSIAKERTKLVRKYLASPIIKQRYPHIQIMNHQETTLFLKRSGMSTDPSLDAVSVFSGGIGSRSDLTIFDDIVSIQNTIERPVLRKKLLDVFESQWLSRIEPDGSALLIGTIWHIDDLVMNLIKHELTQSIDGRRWSWLVMGINDSMTGIECRYSDDIK